MRLIRYMYGISCEITSFIVDLTNKSVRWVFIVIQDGWTVLHVAVDGAIQRHRVDLVYLLLSRGASIDITNKVAAFFLKCPVQVCICNNISFVVAVVSLVR